MPLLAPVSDVPRLMFAAWLGVSVCTVLLIVPRVSAVARGRVAPTVAAVLLGACVAFGLVYAQRGHRPDLAGAIATVVLLTVSFVPISVRRLLLSTSVAWRLGINILRLFGLFRLIAARSGWLPSRFTWLSAGADFTVAIAALALALAPTMASRRPVRIGFSIAAIASLVAQAYGQWLWVVPRPSFEALWSTALVPLWALTAVAVIPGQRTPDEA